MWNQIHYQDQLEVALRYIFPKNYILANTKKHGLLPNKYFEVDMAVPELRLCFEFQDFYHYKASWYNQMPLDVIQQKDDIKRLRLMEDHQSLIVIPCWWPGDDTSLKSTINFHRPDLELTHISQEIAPNPPWLFYEGSINKAQLMLASFPESNVMDQGAWWVGEKWDGIRCYWDVKERQLYSRNQNKFSLQSHQQNLYGNLVLDAELWCGRGFFEETQTIVATLLKSTDTSCVRLLCFDEASPHAQQKPFETRYALLLSNLPENHPSVVNAPRFWCTSEEVLQDTLQLIKGEGGEGVMVRKPLSRYLPGRSEDLYKIKAMFMHSDHEALVAKVEEDGALLLQLPDGSVFGVEKSRCLLSQQAVRGDIVTFRVDLPDPMWYRPFHKSTHKLLNDPVSKPVVYRIRNDLSWEDVLRNQSTQPVEKRSPYNPGTTRRKSSSHLWQVIREARAYFDTFAVSKGVDPLNPSFWYGVTLRDLAREDKRFRDIANRYGPKLSSILLRIYPGIGLRRSQFKERALMRKRERIRRFYDKFAASQGMDSLNPVFWYNVELTKNAKSKSDLFFKHTINYSTLVQLYPDIGLQDQFRESSSWKLKSVQKAYFDNFAVSTGRNPRNPDSWYNVTPKELQRYNIGYLSIVRYYEGELSKALMYLYPNIGLRQSQFQANSWRKESDRRKYFEKFAVANKGDALNPLFWYNVTPQDLKQYHSGYKNVVKYHGGKMYRAVTELYPDVGLQPSRFKYQAWKRENDRKRFFDDFAASKCEDPRNPTFWDSVTTYDLHLYNSGYLKILKFYDGQLRNALTQLYPDIGLLLHQSKGTTMNCESDRKEYFDGFAASKGKDPLNPHFWYSVTTQELKKYQSGYLNIVSHYKWKLSTTLTHLYPDIGLHSENFWREGRQRHYHN